MNRQLTPEERLVRARTQLLLNHPFFGTLTIRLKLLKIGTVIVRNTRRIRLMFSSAYPYRELLYTAFGRLNSV